MSTDYLPPMDGNCLMGMNPYWKSICKALKNQGQQTVNCIKEIGEVEKVNVESVLLEGHPADELVRYAEKKNMDIVIMVTLEKTGLNRLLLGRLAGNMVRYSNIPVMVVREKCKS